MMVTHHGDRRLGHHLGVGEDGHVGHVHGSIQACHKRHADHDAPGDVSEKHDSQVKNCK